MLEPIADGLRELRAYRDRHPEHVSRLSDPSLVRTIVQDPATKRMLTEAQNLVDSICEKLDAVTSDLAPWFEVPYFIRRALHQSHGDTDELEQSVQDKRNEFMLLARCLGPKYPRTREFHREVVAGGPA